jgi:hypothetical protein
MAKRTIAPAPSSPAGGADTRKTPDPQPPAATDKSTRAALDAAAEMGTACTRPDERVLAAFGFLNGASTRFETCRDVSFGGVLCALPALAENGLFRHIHTCLKHLRGYYSTLHVIVLLAHMALCRIKAVEQYQPPANWASCWGWTAFPKSVVYGTSWLPSVSTMARKNGLGYCPETGWRPRRNWLAPCMSTGTFASIMAA